MLVRLIRLAVVVLGCGLLVGFVAGLFRRRASPQAPGYAAPRPSSDPTANRPSWEADTAAAGRHRASGVPVGG